METSLPGNTDYDRRLFSGGFREFVHRSRFKWLLSVTSGMPPSSVLEIGCFNARSLMHLSFAPVKYIGLDAGWEGGLTEAIAKYPEHEFKESTCPDDITGNWDLAIALETLEHIPRPDKLDLYLKKIAAHSRMLIATVPNEIGAIFVFKSLYKKLRHGEPIGYSFIEFIMQALGRCQNIRQDEHRGFDYRQLLRMMEQDFVIQKICGTGNLPLHLSTQVGIIAFSKRYGDQTLSPV